MDEVRISPAGDGFYAAAKHRPDTTEETPHGCMDGWVYLGARDVAEDGEEEYEVYTAVRCRRCVARGARERPPGYP